MHASSGCLNCGAQMLNGVERGKSIAKHRQFRRSSTAMPEQAAMHLLHRVHIGLLEAVSKHSDYVDRSYLGRMPFDDHERRNITRDPSESSDKGEPPNRRKVMNTHTTTDGSAVLYRDMPGKHDLIGNHGSIADVAIVGHV
jgi:hypothetical protein